MTEWRMVVRDVSLEATPQEVAASLGLHACQLERFCRTTRGVEKPMKMMAVQCSDSTEYSRILEMGQCTVRSTQCRIEPAKASGDSAAAQGRLGKPSALNF